MQRVVATVVPVLAAAGLLTACGGASSNGEAAKPATQILADTQKATGAASSVHVSGSGTVSNSSLKIDVVAGHSRGGGTITAGGAVLNLILDTPNIFIKANQATIDALTGNAALAHSEADRWLQTSTTDPSIGSLSELLDITKLPKTFTFGGTPTKKALTTFAGVSAIPLLDPKSGGTLYVASTGQPYILGIKGAPSGGGATLSFDHYNHAKVPGTPPDPIPLSPAPATTTPPAG